MKAASLSARLDRMPMVKAVAPFAAGILAADCFTLPLWFLAGLFAVRDTGAVAALTVRRTRNAAHGRVRRLTAPRHSAHAAPRYIHNLRTHGRGYPRRTRTLHLGRSDGRSVARPFGRNLARLGRPYNALCRQPYGPLPRRENPLPGFGAAVSRRSGKLPPADGTPGVRRNVVAVGAHPHRAPARTKQRPAPARCRADATDRDAGRCGRRLPRHGHGRPERHHAGAAHGLFAQRAVAPAGRLGTAHGHRLRTGQPHAVVAAAAAPRALGAQPARNGLHLAVRRGGRILAQRRAGGRDVHDAPVRTGLGVGVRRTQRTGGRRLRDAAVEPRLAGRHQFPALVHRRRGHPRLGRAALPTAPYPPAGAQPAHGRPRHQPRGGHRHGTPRIAHLRHSPAGGTARQSRGDPRGKYRRTGRHRLDDPSRKLARPGLRRRAFGHGRPAQHAGPSCRGAPGRICRIHPRRRGDGGHLPVFSAHHPGCMVFRAEKSVHLPA